MNAEAKFVDVLDAKNAGEMLGISNRKVMSTLRAGGHITKNANGDCIGTPAAVQQGLLTNTMKQVSLSAGSGQIQKYYEKVHITDSGMQWLRLQLETNQEQEKS